jgi:hypothetical protein
MGLRGWETHRGRVYLRYGEPLEMATQAEANRESMNPVADPDQVEMGLDIFTSQILFMPKEAWHYEDMTFAFGGGMTSGNLKLWPSDRYDWIDSIADFERLAEETPESDKVEGGRRILDLESSWYCFESAGGERELIPVAQTPAFELIGMRFPQEAVSMPVHFVILDETWQVTGTSGQSISIDSRRRSSSVQWVGDVIRMPAGTPESNAAFAAIEIVPSQWNAAFASRDTLQHLPSSGLRISSLVAATDVRQIQEAVAWPTDRYFARSGQAIVPRPTGQFGPNEPIYLYFEIYDLSRDEIGATRYQIALAVTSLRQRGLLAPVVDALGELVGSTSQEATVTLIFDREGIQTRTGERLRIVFPPDRRADSYLVEIEVIDQVSGETFSRSLLVSIR